MEEKHLYPHTRWRLLNTGLRDGASNMAIDEAILEAVTAGQAPPTLRFYGWQPPCLSLGFGQSATDVDRDACARKGWDIVRRPTGGRAILHVDELTYSVCAPQDEPRVAGGIVESYGRLAAGLLAGLKRLGLDPAEAKPTQPKRQGDPGPVCFDGPARYEVTVSGRKLVGSAQSRRLGGVLQHGTLPLVGDITRILDALYFEGSPDKEAARRQLNRKALTLETALGSPITINQATEAMAAGFAQALSLDLAPDELTPAEQKAANRIRVEKYASPEWTFKK
jgi:lipoate-protein ligase A